MNLVSIAFPSAAIEGRFAAGLPPGRSDTSASGNG